MTFDKLYENTFKELQMNAGIIVDDFDPKTRKIGKILGATSGGITIADQISTTDLGEDIDNCPKNMKELMQLDSHNVTAAGTFVTVNATQAVRLAAAAKIDPDDPTHIIPQNDLTDDMFQSVWFLGDYSDKNSGEKAGYLAVHLLNAINTGGFNLKTTDKAKGQFSFTFTACYSMDDPEQVPYEIYVRGGEGESSGDGGNDDGGEDAPITISLDKDTLSLNMDDHATDTLTVTTNAGADNVTWTSSNDEVATVDETGETVTVTAVGAGSAEITASVTAAGNTYTAKCEITVEGA